MSTVIMWRDVKIVVVVDTNEAWVHFGWLAFSLYCQTMKTHLTGLIHKYVEPNNKSDCWHYQKYHWGFLHPSPNIGWWIGRIESSFCWEWRLNWPHIPQWAHIEDFLQVIPRRLLIPDETLKTSDRNQQRYTIFPSVTFDGWSENCVWRVVAVTLEKKVAIVVMLRYRVVARSSSLVRKEGSTMVHH